MEVADKLYDLAMVYWDLQKNNYDIEHNYRELLECDFTDPDLMTTLDSLIARPQQIQIDEKPPIDPEVDHIFREDIAPVPNNSVINAVARAIMAGGKDFASKAGGWRKRRDKLVYEVAHEKAGTIKITIEGCEDRAAIVKNLSVFTLDVLVGVLGHLCFAQNKSRSNNPQSAKTVITARQLLQYKNISSYGERRWKLLEKVREELGRLEKFRISVKHAISRKEQVNYQGSLVLVEPVKRDFNPYTSQYISSAWDIHPGNWAGYVMSKSRDWFVGKLNREVFKYEHREQRGAEVYAKKLMYALFIIPGGTYYLKYGARKSLADYLKLIGEYHENDDANRNTRHRNLKRMGAAIDFLIDHEMIKTNLSGSLTDHIQAKMGPWNMRKVLGIVIDINPVTGMTCPT